MTVTKVAPREEHPWVTEELDEVVAPKESGPPSYSDDEDSTKYRKATPHPQHTYIIRLASDGRKLTLVDGEVTLSLDGALGSIYWKCVETSGSPGGGMIGFRNKASGMLLGHDNKEPGRMICTAVKHMPWEHMQIRPSPTVPGAYTLYLEYQRGFRPVEVVTNGEVESLQRAKDVQGSDMAWFFEAA